MTDYTHELAMLRYGDTIQIDTDSGPALVELTHEGWTVVKQERTILIGGGLGSTKTVNRILNTDYRRGEVA